ncbi:MAG: response regulator [Candidatus Sumerlaeaceae bacterium]|nr:response regulator [Candidatus Sumerlaeaceae bacterium]
MRILLVDDNPDAVRVIESFLKALDHVVFSYTDAREALLWLKDVRPEIVVADLEMPGMNGYEFIRRLHAYLSFAAVPVICITGTEATDEEIYAAGFSAILRKPVTLADMLEVIDTVVAKGANESQAKARPPESKASLQDDASPTAAPLSGETLRSQQGPTAAPDALSS